MILKLSRFAAAVTTLLLIIAVGIVADMFVWRCLDWIEKKCQNISS